jgi:hypothetical protein
LREHHHVEPTLPLLRAARPYLIAAIAGSLNQPLVLVTGRVETAGALVQCGRPKPCIVQLSGAHPTPRLHPLPGQQDSPRLTLVKGQPLRKGGVLPMSSKLFFHHQLRGCQAGDELMLEEQEFGQLMYRYLQSSGKEYNVRFAYDGDEGWLSLCQQPPDPVMLDVIMSGRMASRSSKR